MPRITFGLLILSILTIVPPILGCLRWCGSGGARSLAGPPTESYWKGLFVSMGDRNNRFSWFAVFMALLLCDLPVGAQTFDEENPLRSATSVIVQPLSPARIPPIPVPSVKQRVPRNTAPTNENTPQDDLAAHEKVRQLARQWVAATEESRKKTSEYQAEFLSLPDRKRRLEQILATPIPSLELPPPDAVTSDTVARLLATATAELELAKQTQAQHRKQADTFIESRKQLITRQKALEAEIENLDMELIEGPKEESSAKFLHEWRAERGARRQFLVASLALLHSEGKVADAFAQIAPLQSDIDTRAVARLTADVGTRTDQLAAVRQAESRREVEAAFQEAQDADPALRELAEYNYALAEKRANYAARIRTANIELERIEKRFAQQESTFNSIQLKVDEIGLTEAIGRLLRATKGQLMDVRRVLVRGNELQQELPQIQLELLQAEEERHRMFDLAQLTQQYLQSIDHQLLSRFSPDEAARMVQRLLTAKRDLLTELIEDLGTYSKTLTLLNKTGQSVVSTSNSHRTYINEHVLWIKSAPPIGKGDAPAARQGLTLLLDARTWSGLFKDLGRELRNAPVASLLGLLAITICLTLSDRLKDRVTEVGASKEVKAGSRFSPTLEVLFHTSLIAGMGPAICLGSAWLFTNSMEVSDLTFAIGEGLWWTGLMWGALSFLFHAACPGGLAERHFKWHMNNLRVLRRNLYLLMLLGLPMVFVVMVIEAFQQGALQNSLGRLSFMLGMGVMVLFMHRLLDPYRESNGIWANRQVWTYQLRHVLHALGLMIPTGLIVLTAVGYVYSAHQLAYRAQLSLWLILTVVISHALTTRYFTIVRRRAAIRHNQRRRIERQDSDGSSEDVAVGDDLDFEAIGDQLRRLLRGCVAVAVVVGASFIWADMVPALMMLDDIRLWPTSQEITVYERQADGSLRAFAETKTDQITLANALLCGLAIVGTVVATRNLPGLLNITIFERLPIDYGTRYALTTVTRYALALFGFVGAFYSIGITWGSVQWLVAAMTVGLGFGLQEIFANFVSGLIILSERPIRVGDVVTVGGVTGKVTRMQIRATTITDFDRRELVVPNKRFITEDVINWTLSDPITRVVLPVGIAYNCDPQSAREKLLEAASEHPLVLKEPTPTAIFMGFGESTLDLELRVFIVGRDNLFQVRDELNLAINSAFRAAKLEIAYPQRDLHIRSVDAQALANTLPWASKKAA